MMISVLMMLAAPGASGINPSAAELFDRDPVLAVWARKAGYDRNGDGWLTSYEAQEAAASFKELADGNKDGRVSVREFEEARTFIIARLGRLGQRAAASSVIAGTEGARR